VLAFLLFVDFELIWQTNSLHLARMPALGKELTENLLPSPRNNAVDPSRAYSLGRRARGQDLSHQAGWLVSVRRLQGHIHVSSWGAQRGWLGDLPQAAWVILPEIFHCLLLVQSSLHRI